MGLILNQPPAEFSSLYTKRSSSLDLYIQTIQTEWFKCGYNAFIRTDPRLLLMPSHRQFERYTAECESGRFRELQYDLPADKASIMVKEEESMGPQAGEAPIVNAWSTESPIRFFRVGNYAPVSDELTTFDLPVEGAIPRELNGWYLKNGPNPRQETPHWFTGDGMIHGVRLENGRASWYRNRWVRTESFDKPALVYNADGTRNLHASVANTNVINHAGKTLALVESSLPVSDHKRVGNAGRLRLRRQARRLDDCTSEDLPENRRATFFWLWQPD